MVSGQIVLNLFRYSIADAKMESGNGPQPCKSIVIVDQSGLEIHAVFSEREFDKFAEGVRQSVSKIIRPPITPAPDAKKLIVTGP